VHQDSEGAGKPMTPGRRHRGSHLDWGIRIMRDIRVIETGNQEVSGTGLYIGSAHFVGLEGQE
jgi:hypothetical protein